MGPALREVLTAATNMVSEALALALRDAKSPAEKLLIIASTYAIDDARNLKEALWGAGDESRMEWAERMAEAHPYQFHREITRAIFKHSSRIGRDLLREAITMELPW